MPYFANLDTGPGQKLGNLRDVGDLGELSPSFSSPSFRVGPTCTIRKLGDIWKSLRNFSKLSVSHLQSIYFTNRMAM